MLSTNFPFSIHNFQLLNGSFICLFIYAISSLWDEHWSTEIFLKGTAGSNPSNWGQDTAQNSQKLCSEPPSKGLWMQNFEIRFRKEQTEFMNIWSMTFWDVQDCKLRLILNEILGFGLWGVSPVRTFKKITLIFEFRVQVKEKEVPIKWGDLKRITR